MSTPSVISLSSITNLILSAVKLLLAKNLSVPLATIVAVWSFIFTDELTFSHIGSTTSTTVPSPVTSSPFISIPEVIVTALFLLFDVSATLSAGIATVITPL